MTLMPLFQVVTVKNSFRSLHILNALIAMCRPDPKWPHYFYDLMYGVKWIEYPFQCETGESLKPDLVISSPETNNCIIFEIKGGNNIDNSQAENYKGVQPRDAVTCLHIDTIAGTEPSVDVAYTCFNEASPMIISQLEAIKASFPVFELGNKHFKLVCNECAVRQITDELSRGVDIDINKIPMGYVCFDEESSDSEIAPHVIQTLLSFAVQNRPHFNINEITSDSVGSLWRHLSPQHQKRLKNKVRPILGEAQTSELKGFIKHTKDQWSLMYAYSESNAFPQRRLDSLRKRGKQFVKRLRDQENSQGYQRPLFIL